MTQSWLLLRASTALQTDNCSQTHRNEYNSLRYGIYMHKRLYLLLGKCCISLAVRPGRYLTELHALQQCGIVALSKRLTQSHPENSTNPLQHCQASKYWNKTY